MTIILAFSLFIVGNSPAIYISKTIYAKIYCDLIKKF